VIELAKTEEGMRTAKVPWPETKQELIDYIDSLVDREHNDGTRVYAMSMAAVATFYYVSGKLGLLNFEESNADLDFIRRRRRINGPFILLKGEDALYPQYDLRARLDRALQGWRPWLKEEAGKRLADAGNGDAHPMVLEHWKKLAGQ
jgi:hypothetical protein